MKSHRLLLPLLVGIVLFVTMPAFIYPGDNFAPIVEASYLLKYGHVGIPYSEKSIVSFFLEERGQYFFENDARQQMFSKYGIGNTALYLVSCGISRVCTGDAPLDPADKSNFLLVVNIYNLIFAILAVIYLRRIAGLYTQRQSHQAAFAVLSIFATYLWYYLRSPALEVYQIPLFLMVYYHLVRFLRSRDSFAPEWKQLGLATGFAGVLVLLKTLFVFLLPAIWICALSAGKCFCLRSNGWRTVVTRMVDRRVFLALVLPTVLAIGALFFSNYYRFGSCFSSGYDQWMTPAGVRHDRFSPAFILPALQGFFLARGNHNVFLHYPLLLFAIVGLPRFCRRYPQEAGLVYGMFTLCLLGIVSSFSSWSGELCYGPRYLVHAAILASLPFIETLEIMRERIRSVAGVAFALFTALILVVSARLQINVASCRYFAYDELDALFAPFKHEKIKDYFRSTIHYGTVIGRLIDYVNGTGSFYPVSVLAEDPTLPEKGVTIAKLDVILKHIARPNYYFLFNRESSPAPSDLGTDTAPQQRQSG